MHSEDHFSEEGLFRSRFSRSSFKCKRKCKVRVPSHASVSKYYSDKTYANLWFILLQLTKRFRFQKNKNVHFISGNFSSDRFSRKVKTIRYGLHILINKHLQYRCLEFTILKRTWRIFAKKIINFSLEFRIETFCLRSLQMIMKQNLERQIRQLFGRAVTGIIYLQSFFQYLLLLYAPRLTCNAIPRLVYADFTSSGSLSIHRNLLGI